MSKAKSSRTSTTITSQFVKAKLVSTGNLESSLPVGSKKRLKQYQRNVMASNGTEKALFDSKVKDIIQNYVYDKDQFNDTLDYLNNLRDSEGYHFSRDLKIYSKISDALECFASPNYTSFRWNKNYQTTLKNLKLEFSQLRLKPIVLRSDDDIKNILPKEDTHSGFYWILSGKKKKGDNLEGLFKQFSKEADVAIQNGSFGKPILLGFRTQASGEFEDDGSITNTCKHKTRMVNMVDLISIVNELQFSILIQNYMAGRDYYAGGKDEVTISSILNGFKTRHKHYFSIDYSSFDSTISNWLIEDAFSVIKQAFILDERYDKLFDVMVNDFINKTFVLGEGLLAVEKGVPSGSMWTQIIDTIVNFLVVSTYFNAMGQKAEMMIMGDDNIIFTNYNTSIINIASYIAKNFGLVVKVDDKSAMGSTSDRNGVKFLSRYWRADGQFRHPNQLISRMLFPERFRNYNDTVGPELVVYAYILTYGLGMAKLMDCNRFFRDYKLSNKMKMFELVDSRYLPGSLAFIKEYTRRRDVGYIC